METIYWFLLGLGILVYCMNELQNHVVTHKERSKDIFSSSFKSIREHFIPTIDSSIPLSPYATKQATTPGWTADAPATVLANSATYRNNLQGGIFGATPPYLYVQPQSLEDDAQNYPYDISDTNMSVALKQDAGLLPPNYRLARGNGRVRQVADLYM